MEKTYIPEWATKGPIDFEYRHYKLLAEVKSLNVDLKNGLFSETLKKVDDTLDYLYHYDAEKIFLSEDLSNYELTGINLSNFDLEYTQKELDQNKIMDALCDEAIDIFEELHSKIRGLWREIELGLKVAYVPRKKYILNDGFVFITTINNELYSYYFNKPSAYINDWRSFKLEFLNKTKYTKEVYLSQLKDLDVTESDKIIFKVECNNTAIIEGFAIEIIKSTIYHQLRKDYSF